MKYQTGEKVKLETQVDQNQFGEVELAVLLMDVKALEVPVLYEITEGGSVFSTPIVHRGVFYCGCCDHNFYALDARTGQELWRFKTNGVITLDAVLEDGIIYFGSFDNNLYALDLEGKLVWKFQTNGGLGTPAVHNGIVYVGSEDKNLYAIDAKTGQELWRFRTGGPLPDQPTIYKGAIYFGSWDHYFYALSLDGKRVLWKFLCGNTAGGATVYKGNLYFGSFDHYLYSVTPQGKLLWKYQAPAPMYCAYKPVISNDVIYLGLKDDYLYAISTEGKLLWKFKTGNMVVTLPAVQKGVVYFGSCDGNFYALDARTGQELWRFTTSLPIVGPAVGKDKIYFGGGDCNFYCLDLDGKLVWKTPTSLSYPSWVNLEAVNPEPSANIVWELPEAREEGGKYSPGEVKTVDYGDFKGNYIDITKASYIPRKKSYA